MSSPHSQAGTAGLRPVPGPRREALYSSDSTREIERAAAGALPPHTLMNRAGLSVARLGRALQPHASVIWIACGPGNNGGDGLVAASHLQRWAKARGGSPQVVVTHAAPDPARLPPDARQALQAACDAGVVFSDTPPAHFDLAIDALLGIGQTRPLRGDLARWLGILRRSASPVLSVDLPTGLQADTGMLAALDAEVGSAAAGPRHTLSLLTLKPGLFTGSGRDAAGELWFDDLGVTPAASMAVAAWLEDHSSCTVASARPHASHKGSFGDVLVIGGQGIALHGAGMTGAAVLAARAALHAGAGRVFVGLLEDAASAQTHWDPVCPELMFRRIDLLLEPAQQRAVAVVCGCGGGTAVAAMMPRVLSTAAQLVLDADALNAIASDSALQTLLSRRKVRGWTTVLTPHPLEAARLLGTHTAAVMSDRLRAAQTLSERFGVMCVLKGSGTVVAAPGEVPHINHSGNAALATAGTGDVLAGMIGSALARPLGASDSTLARVGQAVFQHGVLADRWDAEDDRVGLSASRLAARVRPWG